jgi:hypothetical protein
MRSYRTALTVVVASLSGAALVGVGASPASAAGTSRFAHSKHYAGYVGAPGSGIASVSSTFRVPGFACANSTDIEQLAFGPETFDAAGANNAAAGVLLECNNGVGTYSLAVQFLTTATATPTFPGDLVTASISEDNGGFTSVSAVDLTASGSVSVGGGSTTGTQRDVTFLEGMIPGGVGHLAGGGASTTVIPTFATVALTQNQVNGQYLGEVLPTRYDLKEGTDLQAVPNLITRTSENFKLSFKHNT